MSDKSNLASIHCAQSEATLPSTINSHHSISKPEKNLSKDDEPASPSSTKSETSTAHANTSSSLSDHSRSKRDNANSKGKHEGSEKDEPVTFTTRLPQSLSKEKDGEAEDTPSLEDMMRVMGMWKALSDAKLTELGQDRTSPKSSAEVRDEGHTGGATTHGGKKANKHDGDHMGTAWDRGSVSERKMQGFPNSKRAGRSGEVEERGISKDTLGDDGSWIVNQGSKRGENSNETRSAYSSGDKYSGKFHRKTGGHEATKKKPCRDTKRAKPAHKREKGKHQKSAGDTDTHWLETITFHEDTETSQLTTKMQEEENISARDGREKERKARAKNMAQREEATIELHTNDTKKSHQAPDHAVSRKRDAISFKGPKTTKGGRQTIGTKAISNVNSEANFWALVNQTNAIAQTAGPMASAVYDRRGGAGLWWNTPTSNGG